MATEAGKSTPTKTTTPARAATTPAPDAIEDTKGQEAGNLATDGDVVGSTAVPGVDVDAQDQAIKDAGSTDRSDHVIEEGVFIDPSTVGAGTILPGGGYGDPLPDPQVQRKNADEDYQVK
jgi:hypothetical protein